MKKLISICLLLVFMMSISACAKKNVNLKVKDSKITLENEYISITFNESNGSINTIYNKVKDLYLVKDDKGTEPISILYLRNTVKSAIEPKKKTFAYKTIEKSNNKVELGFSWSFENGVQAESTILLEKGVDEVIFKVKLLNLDSKTLNVKYPIVGNVSYLDSNGENDYVLTSFATGYLIEDPINSMSQTYINITGDSALYPSGFGSTMQFMSYYSKDKGGFNFETRDTSDTIKSYDIYIEDELLKFSITHYVDDLSFKEEDFSYDTSIKNLYEGNWYEPAEIYKEWAVNQPWCTTRGKNKDRTDLNKDLFENMTLSNFVIPSHRSYSDEIYNKIRNLIDDDQRIMNIPYYSALPHYYRFDNYDMESYVVSANNQDLFKAIEDNNDILIYFEYTDIEPYTVLATMPENILSGTMKDFKGNDLTITFGRTPFHFFCASNDLWTQRILDRDKDELTKLKAHGLYNDVGLTAVHPLQCFDTSHNHGTRVNVTTDFYKLMSDTFDITREYSTDLNKAYAGQEMITEKGIPYIDFYQTRSAGGYMSEMEHDHIMPLLKIDKAFKIPLFEYIYSEYAGMRLDGYTFPIATIGDAYYYTMAYCILNGYIAQYNYENSDNDNIFDEDVSIFDEDMIRYMNTLGKAKVSYGKDYLNYPIMVRVPELNIDRVTVHFNTPKAIGTYHKEGDMKIDPVVSSAYRNKNNIGIFLINVLSTPRQINFEIDANKLYGIKEGNVSVLIDGTERVELGSLNKGKITINLNLNPRQVYMIEIK